MNGTLLAFPCAVSALLLVAGEVPCSGDVGGKVIISSVARFGPDGSQSFDKVSYLGCASDGAPTLTGGNSLLQVARAIWPSWASEDPKSSGTNDDAKKDDANDDAKDAKKDDAKKDDAKDDAKDAKKDDANNDDSKNDANNDAKDEKKDDAKKDEAKDDAKDAKKDDANNDDAKDNNDDAK